MCRWSPLKIGEIRSQATCVSWQSWGILNHHLLVFLPVDSRFELGCNRKSRCHWGVASPSKCGFWVFNFSVWELKSQISGPVSWLTGWHMLTYVDMVDMIRGLPLSLTDLTGADVYSYAPDEDNLVKERGWVPKSWLAGWPRDWGWTYVVNLLTPKKWIPGEWFKSSKNV